MKEFKGAIFDLDGTVLNSMGLWKKVDELFFTSRNMPIPEGYIQAISPLGTVGAAHYTKETYKISESIEEIIEEWQTTAKKEYAENVTLKPHAKEYIMSLKEQGLSLAVATASDPEMFGDCLKKYGIDTAFDFFITVNEAGKGKGHPDIYLKAAHRMGIEPSECMIFEDILTALTSAKGAGFYCVAMYDESSKKDTEKIKEISDRFIFDFEEMYNDDI